MLKKLKNLILQENFETTTIGDMIQKGEFNSLGKAVVGCEDEITKGDNEPVKILTDPASSKCHIYYISEDTLKEYTYEGSEEKPIYTVPCDAVVDLPDYTYNNSDEGAVCTVEKKEDLSSSTNVEERDINQLSFEDDGSAEVECNDIIMNDRVRVETEKDNEGNCYVYRITDDTLGSWSIQDAGGNSSYKVPCNAVIKTDEYSLIDDKDDNGRCTLDKVVSGDKVVIGGGNPIYTNDINFSDDGEAEVDCGSEIIISGLDDIVTLNTNIKSPYTDEKCIIYKIDDNTVKKMETTEDDKYTYIIPCGSAIYNLTDKYKRVYNEDANTCTVKPNILKNTRDMIENNEFNNEGQAIVDCNSIILDSSDDNKELDITAYRSEDKCVIFNINDNTVKNYREEDSDGNKRFKVPCISRTLNLTSKYNFEKLEGDDQCFVTEVSGEGDASKASAAAAEAARLAADAAIAAAAALPQTKYTITMQQNGEFDSYLGMATIKCGIKIIDSNTKTELNTSAYRSTSEEGKCNVYNISDQTVINWANQGTASNPEYEIPRSPYATYNLSSKYIIDTTSIPGQTIVKKAVISLVDNDKFQFEIDDKIKCSTKFTGFKKTNTDDDTTENVCIQNCRNGAPFFMTKDTNRPVCKYRPIYNRVDNKTNIMCPDGKFYKDANRLGIDIDEADMEGVCVATTISYVSTSGYNI